MPSIKNKSLRLMSDIVHWDKYAAYLPDEKRRETHVETTARCMGMHLRKYAHLGEEFETDIMEAFASVGLERVLPSMRSFQFAGQAIEMNPARMYNCSAAHLNTIESFAEGMFLLLSGCGFGYSVQRHHVEQLPPVLGPINKAPYRYKVADSIEGWADAVKVLLESYMLQKRAVVFDYRDIRAAGALLKTSGGRAPGYKPLKRCLESIEQVLVRATGRKLTTVEAHDIMCFIADAVLSGGIRRAAMISLFSFDDEAMIASKSDFDVMSFEKLKKLIEIPGVQEYNVTYIDESGSTQERVVTFYTSGGTQALDRMLEEAKLTWWLVEPQRGRANNSAVILRSELVREDFDRFFDRIISNGTGDPGFFFTNDLEYLINPCGEATIRPPGMFCNLSTINADGIVDQADFNHRARMAARIGVLQAGYTDFHYLRPFWRDLSEEDAQLGVSITGIASGDIDHLNWEEAAAACVEEAHAFAKRAGISLAARITLMKPEGSSSLKLQTSSGAHNFFARYYWRRISMTRGDLMYNYFIDRIPQLVEQGIADPTGNTFYLRLPIAAPEGAKVDTDYELQEFLDRIDRLQKEWVAPGYFRGANSHNVSATAYTRTREDWELLREWVWDRRNNITGISVLPVDDNTYVQAPFEACTKEEFEEAYTYLEGKNLDLTEIVELVDGTDRQGELACSGPNGCEVI